MDIPGATMSLFHMQPKWRPIEEAENATPYQVVTKEYPTFVVAAIRFEGVWYWARQGNEQQDELITETPTHFMPLPDPPKDS